MLLVHFDDGWNTEAAKNNVKQFSEKTQFDFLHEYFPVEEMKDLIRAYLKASVIGIEVPTDMGVRTFDYRLVENHKIKIVLSGGNWVTEGIIVNSGDFDATNARNFKVIHKHFNELMQ